MKKCYRDIYLKVLAQAIKENFSAFKKAKKGSFGSAFFQGEQTFVAEAYLGLRLIISIRDDPKRETTFHVYLGWAEHDCNDFPAQDLGAYEAGTEPEVLPRRDVKFGIINLQTLEGARHQLGYKIPSPFDLVEMNENSYIEQHGRPSMLSPVYAKYLQQWIFDAKSADNLLTDVEIWAACVKSVEQIVLLIRGPGMTFFERVHATRTHGEV